MHAKFRGLVFKYSFKFKLPQFKEFAKNKVITLIIY